MTAQTIKEALTLIFHGIERLHEAFPSRTFTIDGRLVGDIGEVIAELENTLKLGRGSLARPSIFNNFLRPCLHGSG